MVKGKKRESSLSRSPSDRLRIVTEERDQLRDDLDTLHPRLSQVHLFIELLWHMLIHISLLTF